MKSIFDGWSSNTQCFVCASELSPDHDSTKKKWCAFGYGYLRRVWCDDSEIRREWDETCERIAPLLRERFPESFPLDLTSHSVVVKANDVLRLPAELFVSLDYESQQIANEICI